MRARAASSRWFIALVVRLEYDENQAVFGSTLSPAKRPMPRFLHQTVVGAVAARMGQLERQHGEHGLQRKRSGAGIAGLLDGAVEAVAPDPRQQAEEAAGAFERAARVRRGRRGKPASRRTRPMARSPRVSGLLASRRALISGTERLRRRSSMTCSRRPEGGLRGGRPGGDGGRKKNEAGSISLRKSRVTE